MSGKRPTTAEIAEAKRRVECLREEVSALNRSASAKDVAVRFMERRWGDASVPARPLEEDIAAAEASIREAVSGLSPAEQVRMVKQFLVRVADKQSMQEDVIPATDFLRDVPPDHVRQAALARIQNGANIEGSAAFHFLRRYTKEERAEALAKFRESSKNHKDGEMDIKAPPGLFAEGLRYEEPPKHKHLHYGKLSERAKTDLDRLEHYMRTQVFVGTGDVVEQYLRAGALWFECGFRQRDDLDAFIAASEILSTVDGGPANEMLFQDEVVDFHAAMFCGRWFASGAPRVKISAPQAASLMLTDLPQDFVDADLRAPWAAFIVDLPPGLFPMGDGSDWARRILVHRMRVCEEDALWWLQVQGEETGISLGRKSLYELQREDEIATGDEGGRNISVIGIKVKTDQTVFARFAAMAKLVAGVCYKLQEKPPAPIRSPGGGAIRRRPGGPPQTTETVLGFPVKVDFSNLVREHLLGRVKRLAKVQWLVRGHWRNQACGPQRSERRMTWIEPFWKGPLDAPILVRSHEFKERASA